MLNLLGVILGQFSKVGSRLGPFCEGCRTRELPILSELQEVGNRLTDNESYTLPLRIVAISGFQLLGFYCNPIP